MMLATSVVQLQGSVLVGLDLAEGFQCVSQVRRYCCCCLCIFTFHYFPSFTIFCHFDPCVVVFHFISFRRFSFLRFEEFVNLIFPSLFRSSHWSSHWSVCWVLGAQTCMPMDFAAVWSRHSWLFDPSSQCNSRSTVNAHVWFVGAVCDRFRGSDQ